MTVENLVLPHNPFPDILISDDTLSGKVYLKKGGMGICVSYEQTSHFSCPHCRTKNCNSIKERVIDGSPKMKTTTFGYGVADTVYGTHNLSCKGFDISRMDYPVSRKYYCIECQNEFTKPDLLKAQNEKEKQLEDRKRIIVLEAIQKLRNSLNDPNPPLHTP